VPSSTVENLRGRVRGAVMIGARGRQILQTAGLVAGCLLALGHLPVGVFPSSDAGKLLATPRAERDSPLILIAAGSGAGPGAGSDLVWLVQRGTASGDQRTEPARFPLGFALVERGTLVIFDASLTPITELGSGRATLLPEGERGSFGSANGDVVLYAQISLVPATAVPATLPSGMIVSKPFPAPDEATLSLELLQGILNPTHATEIPAGATPTLLLATDSAIQLETATGDGIDIPGREMLLLTEPETVRNTGGQPAMFVIARSLLTESAATRAAEQSDLDQALDDAWHHYGCHLNPGNPSCLTIGLAAGCAIDATGPGCSVDSDGDRCSDVAEAEAGFDPFDPADCVGSSGGQPAINCLFLTENLACNGDRIVDPEQNACAAEREIQQPRSPSSFSGCDGVDQPPPDACVYAARDPGCDGFAPGESG
jgi:hypothetical protein